MERKYGKWSFAQAESERDPLLSNVKHYNDAPPYPINYPVPNFGVDEDIISTQKHIKDMEKKYGKWSFAQAEQEREPLLSNIKPANTNPGYPINYPVPNFGVDQDILDTQNHLNKLEKIHGPITVPKSFW